MSTRSSQRVRILYDSMGKYERRRRCGQLKEFSFSRIDIEKKILADLSMSLNVRPTIKLHFGYIYNNSELYGNVYLRRIGMSSKRFWELNSVQCCNLDLLEAYLNQRFSHFFSPGKFISIDEGLIKFTGRYDYKQFIPNKPAGEGIKTFAAACAQTGYCMKFFFYRKRFMEDVAEETNDASDCEHDEVYHCDICFKAFCEDHCLPDMSGVIECINCIDHISVQDGSLFIKEGTTVSDTTRWLNFVYNKLPLLVNINKDKKRKSMENKLTPQKVVKHFVNQFDVAEKHVFVQTTTMAALVLHKRCTKRVDTF